MPNYGRSRAFAPILVLWLSLIASGILLAQTSTNAPAINLNPNDTDLTTAPSTNLPSANEPSTNALTFTTQASGTTDLSGTVQTSTDSTPLPSTLSHEVIEVHPISYESILAAILTFLSVGGFLLYQSGLTRAKNCSHSATLLLAGVVFGLIGYWTAGFAVAAGGIGDSHATLPMTIPNIDRDALDHELGFTVASHHWGLMGSYGFFLTSDETPNRDVLFLGQAALLAVAISALLGAALERARILAMAVFSFLVGVLVYPLLANWVWGGGWLAELGHEYGLGHGFIDIGGACVVHETAGTLALVVAMVLGARAGRFGKGKNSIPGHNIPFVVLGAVLLLVSWMSANSMGTQGPTGLAAVNTVLAAAGGLLSSFFLSGWRKSRPDPTLLCRGLLGGAIASCGAGTMVDSWAAFIIGGVAGLLVQGAVAFLERSRLDDPTNAAATHGMAGAWGALAVGLFANGTGNYQINDVSAPVRGLLLSGDWHQFVAQLIGAVTGFVVVFILGYALLILVHKILGIRVPAADEVEGLDWSQTGTLGYQGEPEPKE